MKLNFFILPIIALISANAFSASQYTQDTGKIGKMYVTPTGDIAFQLEGGFINAKADGQCPTASLDSFAGHINADAAFKSALLAAKAAKQTITVTVQGCEANGNRFKILDIYILN